MSETKKLCLFLLVGVLLVGPPLEAWAASSQEGLGCQEVEREEMESWIESKATALEQEYREKDPGYDLVYLGLAQRGYKLDDSLLQDLHEEIFTKEGKYQIITNQELAKKTLVIRAMGLDPEKYYGENLVVGIKKRGKGPEEEYFEMAWALLSDDYACLEQGDIDKIVEDILSKQQENGLWYETGLGWQWITGWNLWTLGPLASTHPEVEEALARAIEAISEKVASPEYSNLEKRTADQLAFLIGGIASLDPDYLWNKVKLHNGKTLFHLLKEFELEDGPGFSRKKGDRLNRGTTKDIYFAFLNYLTMKEQGQVFYDCRKTPKWPVGLNIDGIDKREFEEEVFLDQDFSLPTWVEVDLVGGGRERARVSWNGQADTSKVGEQKFIGKVDGWTEEVSFTLKVRQRKEVKPVPKEHRIIVSGGWADKTVASPGDQVTIQAQLAEFSHWESNVELEDIHSQKITLLMPDKDLEITAVEKTETKVDEEKKEDHSKPDSNPKRKEERGSNETLDPKLYSTISSISKEKIDKNKSRTHLDIGGHWAEEAISYVLDKGYFLGKTDRIFAPNQSMTRAELVTVLGRLAGVSGQGRLKTSWKDVPDNSYYRGYLDWAYSQGIVEGVGGAYFEPNRAISREELATIFFRYLELSQVEVGDQGMVDYVDWKDISPWAQEAIGSMTKRGLLQGRGEERFYPKEKFTRAETAELVYKLDKGQ